MARTVLLARPNCRATRRTAALSQTNPTASSKRLLNGALLGNCGTFPSSPRSPDTALDITPPPPSSETRNKVDRVPRARSCHRHRPASAPQPEQISFRFPRLRRTQFARLIDFVSVNPIPRPTQYFAPVRLSHAAECIQNPQKSKRPFHQGVLQFLAQSRISLLSVGAVRRGSGWPGNCNLSFSLSSVVDLAQIENSPLHRPVGSQAMVLDDTEVVMILAVFFAIVAAQKHADCRVPELRGRREDTWSPLYRFSESDDENTRLNNKYQAKKTEKRP